MGHGDSARSGSREIDTGESYREVALEAAGVGTWEWDLATDAVAWSTMQETLWGFAPGTIPGTAAAFLACVHPDDRAALARTGDDARARHAPFHATFRVIRPDGALRWIESHGRYLVDAQGRPTRLVGVSLDVTERHRLEDAERAQRELAVKLAATSDLDEGLRLCLDAALRYAGLDAGGVYLRDEATGALDLAVHAGLSDAFVARSARYPGDSPNAAVVTANRPVYVPIGPGSALPPEEGLRFAAAIPLTGERGPVGCLNVASRTADGLPPRAREGLEAIAATAANAVTRLRTQRALRDREELFAAVASQALDAVAMFDLATGGFVEFNAATHEGLGYTREEFAALTLGDIQAEHSPAEIRANVERLATVGRISFETRHRAKDGAVRDVHVRARAIRVHDRAYGACVWTDVTDRRRAERELAESEASLRALIEGAPEGIFVEQDGRFAFVNAAMARLLGAANAADLVGREVIASIAPEQRHLVRAAEAEVAAPDPLALPAEHEWVRLDGSRIPTEGTGVAMRFRGRDAHLVFVRDRTAQREAAAEHDKLLAQLHQAQKMESIGRLAGGVAHDFNNLLMVQLGQCELLREGLRADDPLDQGLAEIQAAAQRATALTRQLLAFSRKQPLRPHVFDVNDLVHGLAKMLGRLLGEDVALSIVPWPDAPRVKADPGQLEQVLVNLAVNAREAMPGGGGLTIEVSEVVLDEAYAAVHAEVAPGPHVRVAVSDTGTGMDEATRQRIFEPFFTTKEQGKGTGLGLATVYGIVKQSGGHVSVESELGRGTTFEVLLPRADGPARPRDAAGPAAERGRGELVLLVEDDPSLRAIMLRLLESLGYRAIASAGASEALARVEHEGVRPDLVITDVVMPGLNGRDLVERIRARLPGVPALFMSGYTDSAIVREGVVEEGVRFLQKPFSLHDLAAKVRKTLGAR